MYIVNILLPGAMSDPQLDSPNELYLISTHLDPNIQYIYCILLRL